MSKAFTREDDGPDDDEPELAAPLPAGTRNYMTPGGFARLSAELERLVKKERPELVATVAWAASNGDRSENGDYIYGKKRLREIDRRVRFLIRRLDVAEVVDPLVRRDDGSADQVFFGATVTVARRGRRGAHRQHRRRRRDRPRARLHQLGVADGARAAEGARGRRRHPAHARRRRRARCRSRALRAARHRRRARDGRRLTRRARLTL